MESYVYGYPIVMMDMWTDGFKFNPDGSLDIYYLQAESPGKDKESNWLPTPPGQFNLTVRNYFPKEAAYDGSYKVPPVRKVK